MYKFFRITSISNESVLSRDYMLLPTAVVCKAFAKDKTEIPPSCCAQKVSTDS